MKFHLFFFFYEISKKSNFNYISNQNKSYYIPDQFILNEILFTSIFITFSTSQFPMTFQKKSNLNDVLKSNFIMQFGHNIYEWNSIK